MLAGYQGPGLIKQRNISRNLALAGSRKIQIVVRLLVQLGHEPVVISEACSAERSGRFMPRFSESIPGLPNVYSHYAHTVDVRFVNVVLSVIDVVALLFKENRKKKIDCVIVYNYSIFQVFYILMVKFFLRIPVFLEYEDDAWVNRDGGSTLYHQICRYAGKPFRWTLSGCFAVSQRLINQIGNSNSLLVRGIVSNQIADICRHKERENVLLYTGSMDESKGVDYLIEAWKSIEDKGDWTLVLTGNGVFAPLVIEAAKDCSSIHYLGVVTSEQLVNLMSSARIGVNPHRMTTRQGNVFPFKIIEYLAAGLSVLSTPMLEIEQDLKPGITFTNSDTVNDIADGINSIIHVPPVIDPCISEITINRYGENAVKAGLSRMLEMGGIIK